MKKWQGIVKGELKKECAKKLAAIAATLGKFSAARQEVGLMGGKSGVALFLAYYANFSGEEKFADRAYELLTETTDTVNDGFNLHTFASGLAGIGWTVEHLVQQGFFQADTNDLLSEIDPFLQKMMIQEMQQGDYDYLHAALGIVLYLLRRSDHDAARQSLAKLLTELEKHAEQDKDGLKWLSVLDQEKGTKGYNLSLSHGQASIICILARLFHAGIDQEKVARLIDGAVRFLLNQALDTSKFQANFPSWVSDPEILSNSRLAWCYGDLGCANALWQAAQATGNKEWQERSLATLRHAAQRRDLQKNGIIDAGLCHGSSGVAHIFNRFFQKTGRAEFKECALYWIKQTMALAVHDDGLAGYKAWHTEKYGGWIAESGLLEGAAGIGLVLLSALANIEPDWDESLLLH